MTDVTERERLLSVLLDSGKVRIAGERLKALMEEQSDTGSLLVLLEDLDEFRHRLAEEPAFAGTGAMVSDTGLEQAQPPPPGSIVIFGNELPGPIARLNISWPLFTEMIAWEAVAQVELIEEYHLT